MVYPYPGLTVGIVGTPRAWIQLECAGVLKRANVQAIGKMLPLAKKALPIPSNTEAGAKRAKAVELAKEGLSQADVAR